MTGWLILQNAARYLLGFVEKRPSSSTLEWGATILGAVIGFFVGGAAAKLLATRSERRLIRPFGLAVSLVMVVMWLLPILWVGGSKQSTPGMPYYMQNLHRISCLFTHSSRDWKTVHYEVQFEGSNEWIEGFEPGIFPQSIFGYRGRFNRIIGQSIGGGPRGGGRRWEVAKHIQKRWKELYPADPPITQVRFVRVVHPVFGSHCMANEPWKKLPMATYPENQRRIEDTIDLTKPYRYVDPAKKPAPARPTLKRAPSKPVTPKTDPATKKPTEALVPRNAIPVGRQAAPIRQAPLAPAGAGNAAAATSANAGATGGTK